MFREWLARMALMLALLGLLALALSVRSNTFSAQMPILREYKIGDSPEVIVRLYDLTINGSDILFIAKADLNILTVWIWDKTLFILTVAIVLLSIGYSVVFYRKSIFEWMVKYFGIVGLIILTLGYFGILNLGLDTMFGREEIVEVVNRGINFYFHESQPSIQVSNGLVTIYFFRQPWEPNVHTVGLFNFLTFGLWLFSCVFFLGGVLLSLVVLRFGGPILWQRAKKRGHRF